MRHKEKKEMENSHKLLFGDMNLCNICCSTIKNKYLIEKCESCCKNNENCNCETKYSLTLAERRQK